MKTECGLCKQKIETGERTEGRCPKCNAAMFVRSAWPVWIVGNAGWINWRSNGVRPEDVRIAKSEQDCPFAYSVNALAAALFSNWQIYVIALSAFVCFLMLWLYGLTIFTFLVCLFAGVLPLWYVCISAPQLKDDYALRKELMMKQDSRWRCKFALPDTSSWLWLSSSFLARLGTSRFLYVYANDLGSSSISSSCINAVKMLYFVTVEKNEAGEAEVTVHSRDELEDLDRIEEMKCGKDESKKIKKNENHRYVETFLSDYSSTHEGEDSLKTIAHNVTIVKLFMKAFIIFFLFQPLVALLCLGGYELPALFIVAIIVEFTGWIVLLIDLLCAVSADSK